MVLLEGDANPIRQVMHNAVHAGKYLTQHGHTTICRIFISSHKAGQTYNTEKETMKKQITQKQFHLKLSKHCAVS